MTSTCDNDEEKGEGAVLYESKEGSADVLPGVTSCLEKHRKRTKKFVFYIFECCWHTLLVSSVLWVCFAIFGFILVAVSPLLYWFFFMFGIVGPFLFGLGWIAHHPLLEYLFALFRLIPQALQTDLASIGFVGGLWIVLFAVDRTSEPLSNLLEYCGQFFERNYYLVPVALLIETSVIFTLILAIGWIVMVLALLLSRKLYVLGRKIQEIRMERLNTSSNAPSEGSCPCEDSGRILLLFFVGLRTFLVVGCILSFGWYLHTIGQSNQSNEKTVIDIGRCLGVLLVCSGFCFAAALFRTKLIAKPQPQQQNPGLGEDK